MATTIQERLRQVGAMIIRRRLDLDMKTKIKLAEATGLSTRVIGDIESGKRRASTTTYVQIETALKWPAGTIDGYLDGFGSLLDDEVHDPFVDAVLKHGSQDEDRRPDLVYSDRIEVNPMDIDDDAEAMQEFLRQRAERKGKSLGRQMRHRQDEAESGTQDPGGMEPS